jgi:integrase/recombinase XerD
MEEQTRICLSKGIFQAEEVIQIVFRYDIEIIDQIKRWPSAQWISAQRLWIIKLEAFNLERFKNLFPQRYIIESKELEKEFGISEAISIQSRTTIKKERSEHLAMDVASQLSAFEIWMRSRRYSENTIKVYCECLRTFFRYFQSLEISEISENDLIEFNTNYILAKGYSAMLQNQVVNALKLFYGRVSGYKLDINKLERPRRSHPLPNVLSKEEVGAIIKSLKNIKHRNMISLIYSCGLRRGELLNLKITDIDSNRGLLIIRQAKGNKDRIVPLSTKTIVMLREYYKIYRPKAWLFEGQNGNEQYSERSLQLVLKHALELARIKKPVTLHWLRHSYATHLLENGTDLRYIQEILGHKSSRTTEIYTHVSTQSIKKIKSPFDDLEL